MENTTEARIYSLVKKLLRGRGPQTPEARVTIRIASEMHDRLKELPRLTGVRSANNVVKNALFLYDALVQEVVAGNSIYVISPDGEQTRFPVFIDE